MVVSVFSAVAAADGLPMSLAHAPSVRVELVGQGPLSPYKRVRYVLRHGHGASTIGVTKEFLGQQLPRQQKVGLLTEADRDRLLTALDHCDLVGLTDASAARRPAAMTWTFRVWVGDGFDKTLTVADPELQPDPRYQSCLDAMRSAARRRLGATPFRDVYYAEGTFGYLHVASLPSAASVFVDDRAVGEVTPVGGLLLPVGEHKIELVADKVGLRRVYSVKIMADITTNLDVDLR